ncbi:MAG: 4-(cytidine 5'-diphospho)-2-C-methyl-D-erythritol kinase [Chloroflexota bacterium]|nr:4-(cytidine 5'-diphospho)-2-C-methyl-D-erythritol kinase [Chloroflexota bacterium]
MYHAPGAYHISAPAKVNLCLEVLRRRPDGYHELCTLFQMIDLSDHLSFVPDSELSLTVEGDAPTTDENLVLRAARALREHAPGKGARIHLEKHVPTGAGLGGGSSNAAATLKGLRQLWGLDLELDDLTEIGRKLGADVPFFLSQGGAALGVGRGDLIQSLPNTPLLWLALAVPPFSLAGKTGRVFAALREEEYSDGSHTREVAKRLENGEIPATDQLENALMAPACRAFGELASYAASLHRASGRQWTLTGAGPTLFCVAETPSEARRAAESVGHLPGTRFVVASLPE